MGTSVLIKIPRGAKFSVNSYMEDMDEDALGYSCDDESGDTVAQQVPQKRLQIDHSVSFDGWKFDTFDKVWAHVGICHGDHAKSSIEKFIGFAVARNLEFQIQ
jgi:hypothetical protein